MNNHFSKRILTASAAIMIALGSWPGIVFAEGGDSTKLPRKSGAKTYEESVNESYRAGAVDVPDKDVPSLEDMMSIERMAEDEAEDGDKLRLPAMREAAMAYGARGGLAWASRKINRTLMERADSLGKAFNFGHLMLSGPDGASVRPPVISEALDTYESQEGGKLLRLADESYEIIEEARFQPVPPRWQSYLIREYSAPKRPLEALLPESENERRIWREFVRQGWKKGTQQAVDIFEADLERLQRDFHGMIRYRRLLAQKMVSPPIMAAGRLGVTGTSDEMRVNDRALRITRDSEMVLDSDKWQP